jgi:Holliday junction resolvase RusA-like endonuclease
MRPDAHEYVKGLYAPLAEASFPPSGSRLRNPDAIRLFVPAMTRGKERPRATRAGRMYTPTKTRCAEALVQFAWQHAGRPRLPDGSALSVDVVVWLDRPKAHYTTKGDLNTAGQRLPFPVKKPDADNVLKLVLDALNKKAWRDDAQVIDARIRKLWTDAGEGPTQNQRVLAALRSAGARGITRHDFERDPVIDGGPPILRLARCIGDLEDAGNTIVRGPKRDGVAVYVLTHLKREKPPVEKLDGGWIRTHYCRRCDFYGERPCGPVCPTCDQPAVLTLDGRNAVPSVRRVAA